MSLFNKYENNELNMMFQIINYLCKYKTIDRDTFVKISMFYNIRNYDYVKNKLIECKAITESTSNKNKWCGSEWIHEIPLLINKDEMDYLGNILDKPQAELFLDNKLIDKLMNYVKDTFYYSKYIEEIGPANKGYYTDIEKENLGIIMEAIKHKKNINYEYKTTANTEYIETKCVPYKIEYSAYDKKIWAILYDYAGKRPIKARLSNLRNLRISDDIEVSFEEIEDTFKDKFNNEELVIKIINKKNAKDRFFLLFDNYDKVSTEFIGNDTYIARMKYFDFDEREIIKRLLYLGENVILMKPESLREKVINIIKHSLNNY